MASYIDYLNSISPRWLNTPNGKKFKKAFGELSDQVDADLHTAVNLGRLDICDQSALELHRRNSNLLKSPIETPEQLRAYLEKRWDTWHLSGTKLSITNDLKRFGYPNARVITWFDLVKLGVSSTGSPFGGTYILFAGPTPNGDISYLSRVPNVSIGHYAAPNQTFSISTSFAGGFIEISVFMACNAGGGIISLAKDVVKAINNDPTAKDLVFAYAGGTGAGVAGPGIIPNTQIGLAFPYWSFFYVLIDEPNGFSDPHLWDAALDTFGTGLTYTYKNIARYYWYKLAIPNAFEIGQSTFVIDKTHVWHYSSVDRKVYLFDGVMTDTLTLTLAVGESATVIVGNSATSSWLGTSQGRVYHWDGATWTLVFTDPMNQPIRDFYITHVPLEEGSFMAVGGNKFYQWDGAAWNASTNPFPAAFITVRFSAFSDTDIWCIAGSPLAVPDFQMAHWDGTSWTLKTAGVDYPSTIKYGQLMKPKMTSNTDGWMIVRDNNSTPGQFYCNSLLRFNGKIWEYYYDFYPDDYLPVKDVANNFQFFDLNATSTTDVWFCLENSSPWRFDGSRFFMVKEPPFYEFNAVPATPFSGKIFPFPDGEVYLFGTATLAVSGLIKRTISPMPGYPDLELPSSYMAEPDGCLWDDDVCAWDLIEPYPGALLDIQRVIKKWKPATTSCRFIQIRVGDKWHVIPMYEDWVLDGNGNATIEFYNYSFARS